MILCIWPRPLSDATAQAAVTASERLVSGTLLLQPAADLLNATVEVRLLDTTLIDVAGATLGRQQYRVTGWRVFELPFCFRVPTGPPRRRYSISAEVRRGHASLEHGDYVSMSSTAWAADGDDRVCVPVHRA